MSSIRFLKILSLVLYAFLVSFEPIFHRYHQPTSFLRSGSVRSTSKSVSDADPISIGETIQSKMAQDPVNTGHVVFLSSTPILRPRISCVICILNCAVHVLYM